MHSTRILRNIFIIGVLLSLAACQVLPTLIPVLPTETPAATATDTIEQALTGEKELVDGLGRTLHLTDPARRVVSLAPSNTEIMFAIGAGAQLVGRDQFSDYPEEAKAITDIGGGFGAVNTEILLTLGPDLVLAAALTPPEQVKAIEDLGIKVFVLPNPTSLEGMYQNLMVVAELTAHQEEATALILALSGRVAELEEILSAVQERPLVYYELDCSDPNAPWTSGPGTFIDSLIKMAGGENVGGLLNDAWAQISLETLLAQDPDLILLGDYLYGGVTPEQVAARTGWGTLTAVQNGRVYTFDDNLVSRPGPRLVDGLEALARLLHPELFN